MRVLIVDDGYSRGAVTAVRSLARAGWSVAVGSPGSLGPAAASRHAGARHDVPPAAADPERFLERVRRAIAAGAYDVVLPTGDAELLALSAARDSLAARFPYAAHPVVERALDKLELGRAAAAAGLDVPQTMDPEAAANALGERPVIVKARRHWTAGDGPRPSRLEAAPARGPTAIRSLADAIRAAGGEPFVQPFIAGTLLAYVALVDQEGRVRAELQQEALRVCPPDAGTSARARTVPVDPRLAGPARRMLAGLGWFGVAELQFVRDDAGRTYLVDLNGRVYGSLALAAAAGLDLPAAWLALATGGPVPPLRPAAVGVRYQWLEGDLRRARLERRGGLARDVLGCLAFAPGAAHSLLSVSDPGPAMHRGRAVVAHLLRGRAGSRRAG
ncbi:MAG TPA: ATP-grasp domain-containing protein [Actinomycetota bacterium]|nr:ATP-grasp domain-containing protein [Actinomycetota bacterium]